jgi:hypothetical protein
MFGVLRRVAAQLETTILKAPETWFTLGTVRLSLPLPSLIEGFRATALTMCNGGRLFGIRSHCASLWGKGSIGEKAMQLQPGQRHGLVRVD